MRNLFIVFFIFVVNSFAFEHLTVENFDKKIENKKVIIDFYATWCPPCKVVDKSLKEYSKNKPDDILIYKVDIDKQRDLIKKFDVKSLPTVVFADNGNAKKVLIGKLSTNEIKANAKKYLMD